MFLGLDLGTSSLKALLLQGDGEVMTVTSCACPVRTPHGGWAESDPNDWWQAAVNAVRELPAAARAQVRAVGFSGQMHGVVPCDERLRPLRPAMLWLDQRSAPELPRYTHEVRSRLANPVTVGMAGPSLLWLRTHEPHVWNATRVALQPKDWLRAQLSGEDPVLTDPSDVSGTLLSDPNGHWDAEVLHSLGIPGSWFPAVRASAGTAGTLTAAAAQALGLPEGVPVAVGAADTASAALGSGLLTNGDAQLTVGTAAQLIVIREQADWRDPRLQLYRGVTFCEDGQREPVGPWYAMAAIQNAGVALEWARKTLGLSWDEAYEQAFVDETEVIFLPYLSGERTPLMDPHARGGWLGARLSDSRGQLMRAAFEGVAFSLRAGLDTLREVGGSPLGPLRLAGGGTARRAWRQLLADVLGQPLQVVNVPNASARGAAILAGIAAGNWSSRTLAELTPTFDKAVEPRQVKAYEGRYQRFRDLYPRVKDWWAA